MENASEAIKMAGFVLLFVVALSIAIFTLTNARRTSEEILSSSNNRQFYSYVEEDEYIEDASKYKTSRIVNFDSILPTLYRYYIENYRIEFYDKNGNPIKLYTRKDGQITNAFDLDEEMKSNEDWQANPQATKEHIDSLLTTILFTYKNEKFKEELGIIETSSSEDMEESTLLDDITKQTKRVIRYTQVSQ